MGQKDVKKLRRDHEDAVVERLREALPSIHIKEIRRRVREFDGDATKVLEFFTAVTTNEQPQKFIITEPEASSPPPEDIRSPASPIDHQQDALSHSMEILSLDPSPATTPPEPVEEETSISPAIQIEPDDRKEKARQRRDVSAARKQRIAKEERKEAAKRRRHALALGLQTADDTLSASAQEHILKAIVI